MSLQAAYNRSKCFSLVTSDAFLLPHLLRAVITMTTQGLDDTADMLVYSCAGMLPDPALDAAADPAVDGTVINAEAVPVYDTAVAGAVAAEVPHHHHHHHHHHHRRLAQTAGSEIANGWTVSACIDLTPSELP